MTPRTGDWLIRVGLVFATAALAPVATAAQDEAPDKGSFVENIGTTEVPPLPPGGPTPRLADGKPNLSGVWFAGPIGRPIAWSRTPEQRPREDPIPFRPEVQAKLDSMTRTQIQLLSPDVNCMPKGVPGVVVSTSHPFQLFTTPGMFLQLIEVDNDWRLVYTDKRPHPEYPDPLFNGNSSAWWEGDTLVIDTIGIDERTWVMDNGWYHSDQLRIVERFRRPSLNYLEYQFTAEDPEILTAPWTSAWRTFTLSQDEDKLLENYCTNNENPEQFQKLYEQETNRNR